MTPDRRDDQSLPVARLCDDEVLPAVQPGDAALPVAQPCNPEHLPLVHPCDDDDKPRRRRRRRGDKKPDLLAFENLIPPPRIIIAEIIGLIAVVLIGLLVPRGGLIWGLGLFALAIAMLALIALVTSSGRRSPLQLVWHMGFVGMALMLWFVAARPDRRAEVLIENGFAEDVILELDGKEWTTCKSHRQTKEKIAKRKFVLVTRSAASKKELRRQDIDATYGRKFLLNVMGANTYYHGTVNYVPEQIAHIRGLGGSPGDGPKETRDSWINLSDVDYLFTDDIPRRSRDGGGKKYLLRYRPNLN